MISAKRACINLSLLVLSISGSVLVGEGALRILFNPVDYLKPVLVDDPALGVHVMPGSAGHDSWGYRNRSVPQVTDIVAIGDSQTYGISATASDSWPAQLEKQTGKKVYNLSLGGFGPAQYFYLLRQKALVLKPSLVIVGFYFGNDLANAYDSVYSNSLWKDIQDPTFVVGRKVSRYEVDFAREETARSIGSLRNWLAEHSILYRMVAYSKVGELVRLHEIRLNSRRHDYIIDVDSDNIHTALTPRTRISGLDLKKPEIREGLRLSLDLIGRMHELCHQSNLEFLLLLIPTKESVFAPFIHKHLSRAVEVMDELITNEQEANDRLKAFCTARHISYVDVLDSLRKAVGKKQIYPSNDDGHPNANGYRVIAETIRQYLADDRSDAPK